MKSLIMPLLPAQTRKSKSAKVYADLLTKQSGDKLPHQLVKEMDNAFASLTPQPDRSMYGRYFEFVIGETLAQYGIAHLYFQAELRHVPLAIFDWFLYHPTHPVSISCKTKARERWKQAAYEAMALKRVYSQATNYLITIEELGNIEHKKKNAPQTIDYFVTATNPEYDTTLERIAKRRYTEAVEVSPIINGKLLNIGGTEQ